MKSNLHDLIYRFLSHKKPKPYESVLSHVSDIIEQEDRERATKPKYAVSRTIRTMFDNGLLEELGEDGNSFIRITAEGEKRFRSMNIGSGVIPTSWDGKWRIALLNVSEENKTVRDGLRYILKKAGFACVKNSVWVSPFPFEHFLARMKEDFEVTDELMIIVSDEIDTDTAKVFFERYNESQ